MTFIDLLEYRTEKEKVGGEPTVLRIEKRLPCSVYSFS